MKQELTTALSKTLQNLGLDVQALKIEYPENPEHGDFSTSVALAQAKKAGMKPAELAAKIIEAFKKEQPEFIESVSIAGPGFVNFKVKDAVFADEIVKISKDKEFGWNTTGKGKKIMVEYTDPNPFKVFHIGHLMSNAIGESISRLVQTSGSDVKRANWQGDVGPHVAKAVWGAMQIEDSKESGAAFWGKAYTHGALAYDSNASAKKEIDEINKKIYDRSDAEINKLYDKGRKESLEAFEEIYKRLGTKFDNYFFEGTEGRNGEAIVKENIKEGIFEESEGAIVFRGEEHGLHTRVFITSNGLPTYETKELGLNTEKFKLYPDLAESIIITANEQNDYFKVLLKVFSLIRPEIAEKTRHMSHGIMRFASGKMSSRKGNVISALDLIGDIRKMVEEKIAGREFTDKEADELADVIAIAAIKYTILRQSIGGDVIFDSAASISFEGDSGPYLQYSAVRANSILEKAKQEGIKEKGEIPDKISLVEKLITRFPDFIERARNEYAPQLIANYLIALAGAFNSFYAAQVIVSKDNPNSPYYVSLTRAFHTVMANGLWVLGIKVPAKM